MIEENLKEEVLDALEGARESSDQKPSEEVPSGDVKPAEVPAEVKPAEEPKAKEPSKLEEQVDNLTKALQQEREEAKRLKEKLNSFDEPLTKLKWIFSPQEQPKEETPKFLTQEDVEAYYEQKDKERKEEEERLRRAEELEKEIWKLEAEWDWTNGKPKYDDQEIINWQRENNKLYLSPSDAFYAMKKSEIVDYEVKQKLSWAPEVKDIWKPWTWEQETKEVHKDLDDSEMLNAVREALESVSEADV